MFLLAVFSKLRSVHDFQIVSQVGQELMNIFIIKSYLDYFLTDNCLIYKMIKLHKILRWLKLFDFCSINDIKY